MADDCYVREFYPTCRYVCHSADGRSPHVSVQREEVVSQQPEIEPVPPLEDQYKPLTPLDRVTDPPCDPPSQTSTLSQSEDDIPMIQKLQQLNQK